MIKCPGCGKTLPDGNKNCQFCGADVSAVPRPVVAQKPRSYQAPGAPKWVSPAYYVVSGYYVLAGLVFVLTGLKSYGSIIFGVIDILFGIGLLLKIDLVRGIANILCWIQIALGAFGVLNTLALVALFGPYALVLVLMNVVQIAAAGFMIYLISETDEFANI